MDAPRLVVTWAEWVDILERRLGDAGPDCAGVVWCRSIRAATLEEGFAAMAGMATGYSPMWTMPVLEFMQDVSPDHLIEKLVRATIAIDPALCRFAIRYGGKGEQVAREELPKTNLAAGHG